MREDAPDFAVKTKDLDMMKSKKDDKISYVKSIARIVRNSNLKAYDMGLSSSESKLKNYLSARPFKVEFYNGRYDGVDYPMISSLHHFVVDNDIAEEQIEFLKEEFGQDFEQSQEKLYLFRAYPGDESGTMEFTWLLTDKEA